jgi:AcrR family transcriptional regulator
MARTGRRAGPTTTADDILTAARELFAQRGYRGTSVRAVAARAGVTAALVHHFYGSKERLFVAATTLPINPAELVAALVQAGPRATFGERAVRAFTRAWRDPVTGPPLVAAFRTALSSEQGSELFRHFAQDVMVPRVAALLAIPPLRVTAILSQLVGLAVGRDLVGIEPLAGATEDELVGLFAPVVQGHLDATASLPT